MYGTTGLLPSFGARSPRHRRTSARTTPRHIRAASALVVIGLTAAACGSSATDSAGADTPAAAQDAPAAEPAPATEASGGAADDASAPTEATAPPSDAGSDGADTAAPVAVPAALQFSAPLVGGGEIDASTLADKPTLFWFWAPT